MIKTSPGWAEFIALEIWDALATLKSVAATGLAAIINKHAAKADKANFSPRRIETEYDWTMGGLVFGMADSMEDQGRRRKEGKL
jgi:hypothetical protein